MYSGIKSTRLLFKGSPSQPATGKVEKTSDRKRHKVREESSASTGADQEPVWMRCTSLDDIDGPVFILTSDRQRVLSSDEEGRVTTQRFEGSHAPSTASSLEPNNVKQVFVVKRLTPGAYALKNYRGLYVSCDASGNLSADKEAIGAREEWKVVMREDGVAFQNILDKFLEVDEAGRVAMTSDTLRFQSTFHVSCQTRTRLERQKKLKDASVAGDEAASAPDTELHLVRKFQHGKILSKEVAQRELGDATALSGARQEGRLYEAFLDRRCKIKSDKFCK